MLVITAEGDILVIDSTWGPYQTLVCLRGLQFTVLPSRSSREFSHLSTLSRANFDIRSSVDILQ